MKHHWTVIVGNVGIVHDDVSDDEKTAVDEFTTYVALSKSDDHRCSGETVTLMRDGEVHREYAPGETGDILTWIESVLSDASSCIAPDDIPLLMAVFRRTMPPSRDIVLHLCAENGTNGNPRRCYVVVGPDGAVTAVHDEGLIGPDAWRIGHPTAVEGPEINTTPGEYRAWLKEGSR